MKVYGQLEKADLENLSSAPSSPSRGRVYYDTTLGVFRSYNGSLWKNIGKTFVSAKTASYLLTSDDDLVTFATSGGALNVTFPLASTVPGKIFIIKKTDNSPNALTFVRDSGGADTFDGATVIYASTLDETYAVCSDGVSNWRILQHKCNTAWVSYDASPTQAWGAGTATTTALWRRIGDSMEGQIYTLKDGSGGSGGAVVVWPLPTGYTIDTTKLAGTTIASIVGFGNYSSNTTFSACDFVQEASSTTIYLTRASGTNLHYTSADIAAAYRLYLKFSVPITNWNP